MSDFTDDIYQDEDDFSLSRTERKKYYCPYCKAKAHIKSAMVVYGPGTDFGKVLICSCYPTCNTYVGCHRGSGLPKGTMANAELRAIRVQAHRWFDMLWKTGRMNRRNAYLWLTKELKVNKQVHIGESDIDRCKKIIEAVQQYLSPKLAF